MLNWDIAELTLNDDLPVPTYKEVVMACRNIRIQYLIEGRPLTKDIKAQMIRHIREAQERERTFISISSAMHIKLTEPEIAELLTAHGAIVKDSTNV